MVGDDDDAEPGAELDVDVDVDGWVMLNRSKNGLSECE